VSDRERDLAARLGETREGFLEPTVERAQPRARAREIEAELHALRLHRVAFAEEQHHCAVARDPQALRELRRERVIETFDREAHALRRERVEVRAHAPRDLVPFRVEEHHAHVVFERAHEASRGLARLRHPQEREIDPDVARARGDVERDHEDHREPEREPTQHRVPHAPAHRRIVGR